MSSILEKRFPHAVERLVESWGDVERFNQTFSDLTIDTRGDRSGWPFDAWLELMFLQEVHDLAFGSIAEEVPCQELKPTPNIYHFGPDSLIQFE